MNPCIVVSSCKKDRELGHNQIIRDTWGKLSPFPIFFILGHGNENPLPDEILVSAKDDYASLPWKTQLGHLAARNLSHDWIFQCFTDTFVDPLRLAASNFERGEFVGNKGSWPLNSKLNPGLSFLHGGPGYWLSPRATDLILAVEIPSTENLEDQWVAKVMQANAVPITDDKRYSMGRTYNFREAVPLPTNDRISCHLSDSGHRYVKEMMLEAHKRRFPQGHGRES